MKAKQAPAGSMQHWEVLNEPNLFAHWTHSPIGMNVKSDTFLDSLLSVSLTLKASLLQAEYTRVYDGITSVMHRDHPHLQFAALSWCGTPSDETVRYFMNRSHHDPAAPWPPAYITCEAPMPYRFGRALPSR